MMKDPKGRKLPARLDDTDILYADEITSENPSWRELMLDLGVPLETKWTLSVGVSFGRDTEEPLQYSVLEWVEVIPDCPYLGAEYVAEIESANPLYVSRCRTFYFDHRPTRREVPRLSPLIPKMSFLETRMRRVAQRRLGDPPDSTITFFCSASTHEEIPSALAALYRGYIRSRYWGSGKNPPGKRRRGPKFSKEEYRTKFMSVVKALVRNRSQMNPNIMAVQTDIDMKTYKRYMERDQSLWADGCELHTRLLDE